VNFLIQQVCIDSSDKGSVMTLLKTQYLQLTNEEIEMLSTLMRSSSDDPRLNGLIGTCFWYKCYNKDEEAELKARWTSIEQKLVEFTEKVE
jgi:hypothetical protein